jgi:uncharacterized Zn-finger protein
LQFSGIKSAASNQLLTFKSSENIMSEVNTMSPAVELGEKDLPAHCPNPAMPLWSSHPRVFLEIDHHGEAKCPYCGTLYRLKPGTVVKGH